MTDSPKVTWKRKGPRTKPTVRDYGRTIEVEHHGATLVLNRRVYKNLINALRAGRFNHTRLSYHVIAEWLRTLIESGEVRYGDELPTEQALQDRWNVARGTVRRAYAVIEREGLCIRRHGRGRVVRYPDDHPVPKEFRIEPGPNRVERIADRLRALIITGHFPYGSDLPAVPDCAKMFVVDSPLMRRAIWILEKEGYIQRRPGRLRLITRPEDNPRPAESLDTPCATSSTKSASPETTDPPSSSPSPPEAPTRTPRQRNRPT